jgi:very-short-patch-repair endonuclease
MQAQHERAVWRQLGAAAARQHGLLTRSQLEGALTRHQLRRLVERGALIPCAERVWRVPTAARTWNQLVLVCCLAGGPATAASHLCAGAIWGLEGIKHAAVHVTMPPNRSHRWVRGVQNDQYPVTAHHRDLDPSEIRVRERIPVTGPARTLVDLAAGVGPALLATAVDSALRSRLVTLDEIVAAREGHPVRGARKLDPILEARLESGAGDSVWEDRLWRWIVAAGLPMPARQVPVVLPSGPARLDMAYPEQLVAIEFDGFAWHRTRRSFDRDRLRTSELATAGWLVVQVTSAQSRTVAVRLVRSALEQRGWSARA